MSVGRVTLTLPSRACWWVTYVAKRNDVSISKWLEIAVLRQLALDPGVDLSRSPDLFKRRGRECRRRIVQK